MYNDLFVYIVQGVISSTQLVADVCPLFPPVIMVTFIDDGLHSH